MQTGNISRVSTAAEELEITGTAQREAWLAKRMPPIERLAEGVWSIPVSVPDNPIRLTYSYLLAGDEGAAVLVDPGWNTDRGWDELLTGLGRAGVALSQISGIVITHSHPDHHGLTRRLSQATDAWIAMHPAEVDALPSHHDLGGGADATWLSQLGVPGADRTTMTVDASRMADFLAMPDPTRTLDDDTYLPLPGRQIRLLWTPGHTPGHLSFHDEDNDLLLTGDHVLPRISPNVGLHPHHAGSPLGPYLNSLRRLLPYESVEVLPAHEWRFRGLPTRVRQLLHHHDERLAEILAVLDDEPGATTWQIAQRLTWAHGWDAITGFQRRAALAESAAHLDHLVETGVLDVELDEAGVAHYRRTVAGNA